MTIREWVRNREINGQPTFSYEEIQNIFSDSSEQIVKNELYRLSVQKIIVSVYRGFYVVIPTQYAAKGIVPPIYYIDQLMAHLNKPYYISLLSAAESLGYYCISAFSFILIRFYNGKRGTVPMKYLFYLIYPAHMLLFYALVYFANR